MSSIRKSIRQTMQRGIRKTIYFSLNNEKLLNMIFLALSSPVPGQQAETAGDGPHDGHSSLDGAGLLSASCDLDDAGGGGGGGAGVEAGERRGATRREGSVYGEALEDACRHFYGGRW